MRFLKLGQDMTFYSATPDRVMVHFKIKDMEAVEQFLKDEDLIKFLNDPQTDDENSGCRLTVSRHGEIVTFQRQFETYTIKEEACADLLASLKTYVIPAGSDGDTSSDASMQWCLLTDKIKKDVPFSPSKIPMKRHARGTALVARETGEESGITYVSSMLCR